MRLKNYLEKLYYKNFIGIIFHTADFCLRREIKDCLSVLDLGCGPNSPLRNCSNIKHSVGVEAYYFYLEESRAKGIHSEYILSEINKAKFDENSFDAVIMLDVLEHLPKETGLDMLKKINSWARKKIILSSPNGYLPQRDIESNPFQRHLSGWKIRELKNFGYKVYGMSGLKILRQEREEKERIDTIKYKPKLFWLIISVLTQVITYYIPSMAFELFCVKNVSRK